MPLRRTPPKKNSSPKDVENPDNVSTALGTPGQYDSEPDFAEKSLSDYVNKTSRVVKRRALRSPQTEDSLPPTPLETPANMSSFMAEMRTLFQMQNERQEKQFREMKSALEKQNSDIKDSIQFLSDKYDNILGEIENLKKEKNKEKMSILQLEDKIEQLERQIRATTIELRSIPVKEGETKNDLTEIAINLSNTLNVPIQPIEIRDIFRVQSKKAGNPIIIEFTTIKTKEALQNALKTHNKEKINKLKASDLNIEMPDNNIPIYISDSLTSKARKLHYLARNFKSQYGYTFCWTSHGRVFLRQSEGMPKIRIDDESDLNLLLKKD